MKNRIVQTTSSGLTYTFVCDEGHTLSFDLGYNMPLSSAIGFETIADYLAFHNCS